MWERPGQRVVVGSRENRAFPMHEKVNSFVLEMIQDEQLSSEK